MYEYAGDVLEDLKQGSYLMNAIASSEHSSETGRYAAAMQHALQILDRNRDAIVAYEKTGERPKQLACENCAYYGPMESAVERLIEEYVKNRWGDKAPAILQGIMRGVTP